MDKVEFYLPASSNWESLKIDETEDNAKERQKRNREKLNQQLLASLKMQNLMILCGSGTSLQPVGGPSMWDLWNLCMKKEDQKEYTEKASSTAQMLNYDISDENTVNIEEFLSICEAFLQLNGNESHKKQVEAFVKNCKREILTACSFEKNDNALIGHKTFIHRLSRRRTRDSRLKLFTTNYDTSFEEAASSQGIVIIDGFSFTKPRYYDPRFFDFDIVRRLPNETSSDFFLEGVFQLYKLHGSVNWAKKKQKIFEQEAAPENVCMIFPAKGKYQQSYIQPHLELMARFLSSLRKPNTCLMITGFGFNDDHLSEPIISAIETNPYLKVIIADPSAKNKLDEETNRYWNLLNKLHQKGGDILFLNATFQEFAELIPDLHSLTPAERMAEAVKNIAGVEK